MKLTICANICIFIDKKTSQKDFDAFRLQINIGKSES